MVEEKVAFLLASSASFVESTNKIELGWYAGVIVPGNRGKLIAIT
jgi:hypothetical protein